MASSHGAAYQWPDDALPPAAAVYYWLEAVDLSGVTSLFGPISVVTLPPTGVKLLRFEATGQNRPRGGLIVRGIAVLALLVGSAATYLRGAPPTPPQAAFDPDKVAYLRAQAAVAVDRITGGYSTDVAADWREVERLLQQAYRSVQQAIQRHPAAAQSEQQVSTFRPGN